jgi:hypothetical protein
MFRAQNASAIMLFASVYAATPMLPPPPCYAGYDAYRPRFARSLSAICYFHFCFFFFR